MALPASTPVSVVPQAPQVVGEGWRCGFSFQEQRLIGTCEEGLSCVNGFCAALPDSGQSDDRTGEVFAAGKDPNVTLGEETIPITLEREPLPEPVQEIATADTDLGSLASANFLSRFNDILARYKW